jgi:hypothetical protein
MLASDCPGFPPGTDIVPVRRSVAVAQWLKAADYPSGRPRAGRRRHAAGHARLAPARGAAPLAGTLDAAVRVIPRHRGQGRGKPAYTDAQGPYCQLTWRFAFWTVSMTWVDRIIPQLTAGRADGLDGGRCGCLERVAAGQRSPVACARTSDRRSWMSSWMSSPALRRVAQRMEVGGPGPDRRLRTAGPGLALIPATRVARCCSWPARLSPVTSVPRTGGRPSGTRRHRPGLGIATRCPLPQSGCRQPREVVEIWQGVRRHVSGESPRDG